MADLTLIFKAVEDIQLNNLNAHNDIRNAITDGIKGVHKDLAATAWITNKDLKDIKEHLKELNGTVAELQRESNKRAEVVLEFKEHVKTGSHKPYQWMKKNWWALLLIFIGSVAIIVGLLDYFGLRELWNIVNALK